MILCELVVKRWVYLIWLFVFAFVYSFAASVFIREAVIPEVYPQRVNGHLPSDPFYLISIFESCLMWVGLVGLFFWVMRSSQFFLSVPIICSVSVMTIFAMSIPFLGALYRYRYPWWILLIGLGLAACSDLLSRRSVAAKQKRAT